MVHRGAGVLAVVAVAAGALAFSLGPQSGRVLATLAALTGTSSNASNLTGNKTLVSPSGLTATVVANTSATLSWTAPSPNDGNGYAVSGVNNGTSSTCPSGAASYTTWLAGTASTTYTDTSSIAKGAAGTFACYLVQTGYSAAGGPPWASAPQWTSQSSLATAPVALGIAFKRSGAEATGWNSVSPTITATTAGDLLVASVVAIDTTTAFTGPAGWTRAVRTLLSGTGAVEIWYRANAPSTTSVTFSDSASAGMSAGLVEFSGAATSSPVDGTGTVTVSTAATTATVSTSAAPAVNGDLAFTVFRTSGSCTFTSPAGWTHTLNDTTNGVVADYKIGGAAVVTSELMTCSSSRTWAGAVAMFR